ncbi:unnamed protein product [Leptidea sinapis]|uniref:Uncharacterized protein n=1 Tax=Leptidea sinapis TaxID=189913 RepID=A0A5E4R6K5_9NEOP|nr:unnamed protein product [Leptidea sinapis]
MFRLLKFTFRVKIVFWFFRYGSICWPPCILFWALKLSLRLKIIFWLFLLRSFCWLPLFIYWLFEITFRIKVFLLVSIYHVLESQILPLA